MNELIINKIIEYINNRNYNPDLYLNDGYKNLLNLYFNSIAQEINDQEFSNLDLIDWKKINYQSEDGLNLSAIYKLNPKKTKKWIVSIHGYSSSKESSAIASSYFLSLGYNILAFDFRHHGESQRSFVSLGINEIKDLIATLKYLKKNFKVKSVGLMGFSMGAFTLNSFALKDDWKKYKVKFGISDSTFFSIKNVLHKLLLTNMPIVKNYIDSLTNQLILEYNKKYLVDLNKNNADLMISNCKKTFPILYIHSKQDKITYYKDSEKFYNLRKIVSNNDDIHIFETGEHVRTQITHFKMYWKVVNNFINKNKF